MRLLITGLNGTLAPRLAQAAVATGAHVIGWDRSRHDPDDAAACARALGEARADAIAHLGMGSPAWAGRLAAHAAARGLPMVFTSTAMVFHHQPDGPHGVHDARNAEDDYGRYKAACEDAVLAAHPGATVARIGWQIDAEQPGNNMLMALDGWQARDGRVKASRVWTPACSFMPDTAAALLALLHHPEPGAVHLDSNADEAHRFDAIARALAAAFDRPGWVVAPNDDYRHDQRLAGGGARLPPLSSRLPLLRA